MGNTSLANLHDKISKVDEDARRHLRIINNNDPVPAAALGVDDGGTLSCLMMCVNGETFEHSGTIIWMGRSTGQFRTKSLGILGGLKQAGIRLCSPCAACCLSGSNVSVLDHLTVPYIEKLASFIFDKYQTPMRCLGSNTTVATGGIVKARVWTGVGSAGFIFPEQRLSEAEGGVKLLQEKKDFGICLSGGGFRATTLALGWIRILHKEGIIKQARYLSSNSGGSWFNTAFSYQEIYPLELFLGDYIAPMDLTPKAADRQGRKEGCYATAIAESNFMRSIYLRLRVCVCIDDLSMYKYVPYMRVCFCVRVSVLVRARVYMREENRGSVNVRVCAHTRIRICTSTQTHTHTHAHTHTHTHTHTHNKHTRSLSYTHTYPNAHTYMYPRVCG